MNTRIVLFIYLLALMGCAEEEQSICEELPNLEICVGAKACVPGEVKECPCTGGETGIQSCNDEGTSLSDCECGEASEADGVVATPDTEEPGNLCETHSYTDCVGDNLYWFNSCLEQEDLLVACEPGQCELNATSCCPGQEPGCLQGDIYWFDSCGVKGELKEACGDGFTCKSPEAEEDLPTCVSEDQCTPDYYEACYNPSPAPGQTDALGDVFMFNSCDEPQNVTKVCECQEICNNNACVKTFWDGKWTVSLSGSCALGSAIQYTNVTFDVGADDVVVTANVGGKNVTYNGTMDCDKNFQVTGTLTQEALGVEMSATETWSCQFDSLTHFAGQVVEESDFGTCLYDLEGFRN
jgi:hypothetical protein